MKQLYLDNAASMPMPKRVLQEIDKAAVQYYANPFSQHALGKIALAALIKAKSEIANELGAKPEEIVLTSGGTESNALALMGTARAKKKEGKTKIIISSIEHSSIYENAKSLEKEGFSVREIPATEENGLDISFLEHELDDKTALVSVMSVNSDTGIINDIPKIASLCAQKKVTLHVDHSQGFGKMPLKPKSLGIELLSADAHKIGGPKGVGILFVRQGTEIEPIFRGSEKERVLRAGTENVPGIIGFASALREYKKMDWRKVGQSRDTFETELEKIGAYTTGKSIRRVSTHLHVCFKGIEGESLVNYLSTKGIYCSTGSACDSRKKDRRVLENLGVPAEYHGGAIRFSLGKSISDSEIERVKKAIGEFLRRKNK